MHRNVIASAWRALKSRLPPSTVTKNVVNLKITFSDALWSRGEGTEKTQIYGEDLMRSLTFFYRRKLTEQRTHFMVIMLFWSSQAQQLAREDANTTASRWKFQSNFENISNARTERRGEEYQFLGLSIYSRHFIGCCWCLQRERERERGGWGWKGIVIKKAGNGNCMRIKCLCIH